MKAYEMVALVKKAEIDLAAEISGAVNTVLKKLSEETHLSFGDVTLRLMDVTTVGDSAKRYILSDVRIDTFLPGR